MGRRTASLERQLEAAISQREARAQELQKAGDEGKLPRRDPQWRNFNGNVSAIRRRLNRATEVENFTTSSNADD